MSVTFDTQDYEGEGFKPFTTGWHDCQITDYGDDTNKTNTGEYVWLEFTVTSGNDKGRAFRNYYNYIHKNEETERISREQFSDMARIVNLGGKIVLPDTLSDYTNKKLRVKIKQGKDDDFPSVQGYGEPLQQAVEFNSLEGDVFAAQPQTNEPNRNASRDPYA